MAGENNTGLDWSAPLMLRDGTPARFDSDSSFVAPNDERWVEVWLASEGRWGLERFTQGGSHIRRMFGANCARLVNRPKVNMDAPLRWLDTGERGFVRENWLTDPSLPRGHYAVDSDAGGRFIVDADGVHIGEPPRILSNVPNHELMAEGRLAIKRAQAERARRREQERLQQLADLNPTLFGSF